MHCMTGATKNSPQCKYVQIQSNLWMVYQNVFWIVSYCQQLQHVGLPLPGRSYTTFTLLLFNSRWPLPHHNNYKL